MTNVEVNNLSGKQVMLDYVKHIQRDKRNTQRFRINGQMFIRSLSEFSLWGFSFMYVAR